MIWFNVVFSILIILYSIATIGENRTEEKKIYQGILMLCIFCFFIMNFVNWMY